MSAIAPVLGFTHTACAIFFPKTRVITKLCVIMKALRVFYVLWYGSKFKSSANLLLLLRPPTSNVLDYKWHQFDMSAICIESVRIIVSDDPSTACNSINTPSWICMIQMPNILDPLLFSNKNRCLYRAKRFHGRVGLAKNSHKK